MMTKDKKPFTYTPGGIDLSQIKSPRMAKRVQKNAMSEGVTGPPKVSPLAQPNQVAQSPAATMPRDVTGMPFQVFPTGPPAPPPLPQKQMTPQNGSAPQNGTRRKSPQPQHFEPPPLGCRPEIKIPQNPMANLKPTPRPQPNDDFWIDEYKNDKATEQVLGTQTISLPSPSSQYASTPQSPQVFYPQMVSNDNENQRSDINDSQMRPKMNQQKPQVTIQHKKVYCTHVLLELIRHSSSFLYHKKSIFNRTQSYNL